MKLTRDFLINLRLKHKLLTFKVKMVKDMTNMIIAEVTGMGLDVQTITGMIDITTEILEIIDMVMVQITLGMKNMMITEILEIIGMDLGNLGMTNGKECTDNNKNQEIVRKKMIYSEECFFKL